MPAKRSSAAQPAAAPAAKPAAAPAAKPTAARSASKPAAKASRPAASTPHAKMEKADPELLARVEALMPSYPVYRRPMFGVATWFVEANAQMLCCVWGDAINIRVGQEDARALVASGRARPFEPLEGRTMREYVLVPAATLRPADLRRWFDRALAFTSTLPPKKGK